MIMCRDGRLIQFAKFLFVELLFINVFVVFCLCVLVCVCVRFNGLLSQIRGELPRTRLGEVTLSYSR